jgi:hypothetical protein
MQTSPATSWRPVAKFLGRQQLLRSAQKKPNATPSQWVNHDELKCVRWSNGALAHAQHTAAWRSRADGWRQNHGL